MLRPQDCGRNTCRGWGHHCRKHVTVNASPPSALPNQQVALPSLRLPAIFILSTPLREPQYEPCGAAESARNTGSGSMMEVLMLTHSSVCHKSQEINRGTLEYTDRNIRSGLGPCQISPARTAQRAQWKELRLNPTETEVRRDVGTGSPTRQVLVSDHTRRTSTARYVAI